MSKKVKLLALAMAALTLASVGLSACGNNGYDGKDYTLNEFLGASPLTWNPHTWETNADNYMAAYCEMGFVDVTIAEDGVNYEWVYEMADSIEDITATFEDREKWGITAEEQDGRVFKITLNKDATWQDGTKINADTYMYSIKALLDPKMQNYRANTYYNGAISIKNAAKYFKSETPIYEAVVPAYGENDTPNYSFDIKSQPVFVAVDSYAMTLTGDYSINDLVGMGYVDTALAAKLAESANAFGYTEVTAALEADVKEVCTQFLAAFGLAYSDDLYKEMLFYNTGKFSDKFDFENVGIYKTGDYEFIYITDSYCQMFDFMTNMTGNWIVYEPLYEGGKDTTGDLVATNYGTSAETYMSYGPYKLASFEKDKQIVMDRNEAWYGYSDGKHKGQYQTTAIKCDIIADHNTALQLFNQGKLDSCDLTSDDMAIYKMSDYLLKTDQTYTFRYIFASDINKLAALEAGANDNKKVLSYDDFRKAISLSMDRATFCTQATSGYKPAYYLFNSLYYYDIGNNPNSIYRNSEPAMKAIVDLYGIEYGSGKEHATLEDAYKAITGYDVEEAKKLFQSVYEQAKKDGNYKDGQTIAINCMASAATELTADDLKQEQLLNEFITAATAGTGFEGKVSFKFNCGAENRYEDVAAGKVEMIRGAWGGAAFYPVSTIRCYTEPDYMGGLEMIHESCGWDPSKEVLALDIDMYKSGKVEKVERTLQDWAKLINGGIKDASGNLVEQPITDPDTQLVVMAALENAVLGSYQCVPFAAETACNLFSKQIKYATLDYNIMYGYGGVRLMTYNYDDAAWDSYVASQGGTLSYE